MLGRSVLIGAVLALCGVPTRALPVHLAFDWPSGTPASTAVEVHIYASRMAGAQARAAPVQADAGKDGVVLDLGEGVWLVQAFTSGYWCQGAEVSVGGQASSGVRLALWPAASLQGQIAAPQAEPLPTAIYVKLNALPASAGQSAVAQPPLPTPQPGPARAVLICPVDQGKWSCLGPAGLFDVRLEAEGYAPRYDWGVSLKAAESTDLGPTELERALSVFGRAVRKDGSAPPGPCRATLLPDAERPAGPDAIPDNAPPDEKTFTVPLNPQGYFQVVGVMPGKHSLAVECQGASGFAVLHVQSEGETRVDPPMVLEQLTLDVAITPRTDPAGQPWQLTVDVTSPRLRRIADSVTASADGHWIRRGLMAGSYRVAISSSDGMPWFKEDFDLRPDSGPLALRLASVRVAGKVLLSGLPVRARLDFSNEDGREPVTLNSDEQGRFAGLLPIAPDAKETAWIVEAHVAHPLTVRRLVDVYVPTVAAGATAPLDLELPTIPVRGTVVSEDGRPQIGAQVTFVADGSGYQTTASTDGLGSFEMADLPPGKYNAVAESSYGLSDPTPFAVTDDSESHLKLILHPNLHIPFYVVAKDEEPLSDVTVQVWLAPGVPHAMGRTNRDGRFEATLPPGTTEVGLTVGASDYAIRLLKMPVSSTPVAAQGDSSQNQNTVTLDTNGGSLVLNFEPSEGTLDRSATLYLAHNGALVDARTLAGWGTDQAGANSDGPAEVDAIEPGDYALCVVTDPSQLAALWQGNLPPDRCSMGTVKPGQTLTLTPQ
jgi:hypothetical protein